MVTKKVPSENQKEQKRDVPNKVKQPTKKPDENIRQGQQTRRTEEFDRDFE